MQQTVKRLDPSAVEDISRCFQVFTHLRPKLDEAQFTARLQLQVAEGYRIVYFEEGEDIVAAAGYRIVHFLAWGRVLYLDDFITRPESRKSGYGSALMHWLSKEGQSLGCEQLHLDSGYQRHDAHRFYLRHGFALRSHHCAKNLQDA